METDTHLIESFHAHGHRLTHQRRLVLQVLAECSEHLDAETVFIKAKARDPKISLATVYRSLSILKELDLVREHPLGESHGHFEIVHHTPHYHFTCSSCSKVIEFDAPQVKEIANRLSSEHGLSIHEMHLYFNGTCADCLQKVIKGNSHTLKEKAEAPGRVTL